MAIFKFFAAAMTLLLLAEVGAQSRNAVDCVNEIFNWCRNRNYGNSGYGSSVISNGYIDGDGQYRQIYCMTNSYGMNCFSNNFPWYSCTSDHRVTYKGRELQEGSADGTDEEICSTAREVGGYNSEQARKIVQKTMSSLQPMLSEIKRGCFPFCYYNPFGQGFPFNRMRY